MNQAKIDKLRVTFEKLRRKGGVKPTEMEGLAIQLGRVQAGGAKHPTWASQCFPSLRDVSIPHHGHGRDLTPGTKNAILDQLEEDLEMHEQSLD